MLVSVRAGMECALLKELRECSWTWGQVGIVGLGKPRFGVKSCRFCRCLETEDSDLKRGVQSQAEPRAAT